MKGVMVLAVLFAVAVTVHADPTFSGMKLRPVQTVTDSDEIQPLEVQSVDSNSMRMSSIPDVDIHEEMSQAMSAAQEDGMDVGGGGEQMQLSGASLKGLPIAADTADVDDESDVAVSADMSKDGKAMAEVFSSKATQLWQAREELEDAKYSMEKRLKDAKRLIQEAYSKQAYLNNLQKHILEQSVAVEQQQSELKAKEASLEAEKADLERAKEQLIQQSQADKARATMSAAIQTQLKELTDMKHISASEADREMFEKTKIELEEKSHDLDKKESEMKKLFMELTEMKKAIDRHETSVREKERRIKMEEDELRTRESEIAAEEKRLRDKAAQVDAKEEAVQHARRAQLDSMVDSQFAIQTDMGVDKDLSELPREEAAALGVPDEMLTRDAYVMSQPLNLTLEKPKLVVSQPAVAATNITIEDRSARSVETRMDERPPTYGQKLLVGQAYSATYSPPVDLTDHRDPDGLCRNSRMEVVPCHTYGKKVPPLMMDVPEADFEDGGWHGPCVVKCSYHKGPTSSAGPKNIQELAIEIPTDTGNHTYACPRTNNGYPFLSCSLLLDGSDKCRTTCVFDGDANPLKPKHLGIGLPSFGQNAFRFNVTQFRSLAHTTYSVVTDRGCKSSMKADPLVACEVRL